MPREASSLEELRSIVTRLSQKDQHWQVYKRIADSLGVALAPDEIWLLVQLCRIGSATAAELSVRFRAPVGHLDTITGRLASEELVVCADEARWMATERGYALFNRMVDAHRSLLIQFAARWSPNEHAEAKAMLDGLAQTLIAELPTPARTG
jgi:hypothetical protein